MLKEIYRTLRGQDNFKLRLRFGLSRVSVEAAEFLEGGHSAHLRDLSKAVPVPSPCM